MRLATVRYSNSNIVGLSINSKLTIAKVYKTHQNIQKDSLVRDRPNSVAALLPNGEISELGNRCQVALQ
jgi:hypothetical protein